MMETKRERGRPPAGDAPQTWRSVSIATDTIAKANSFGLGINAENIRFAVEFAAANGGIEAARLLVDAKAKAEKEAAIKRLDEKAAKAREELIKARAILAEVEAAKAGLGVAE